MDHLYRRRILRFFSLALAAILLTAIVSRIRFKDHYRVRIGQNLSSFVERSDVVECRTEEGRLILLCENGETLSRAPADVVVEIGLVGLLARADKSLLILLVGLNAVALLTTAIRWQLLLRSEGVAVPFRLVFLANHAGAFLNNVLPGSVAGDVAKVFLLPGALGRVPTVAGTVLLTRVIGLFVTAVIASLGVTLFLHRFPDARVPVVVYGLSASLTLVSLIYVFPSWRGALGRLLPRVRTLQELNQVFVASTRKSSMILKLFTLSLLTQLTLVAIFYGYAKALSLDQISFGMLLVAHPIASVVTALPLSPGGLGIREGAFVYLFGALGGATPTEAVALAIIERMGWLIMTLPGGLFLGPSSADGAEGKEAPKIPDAPGGLGFVSDDGFKN